VKHSTIAGLAATGVAFLALLSACAAPTSKASREAASPGALPATDRIPIETLSTEPWKYAGAEGSVIRTAHYRIFTTVSTVALRDRAPGFLDHALSHYRTALGPLPLPSARLDTYLLDNRAQWSTLTRQLMGAQAETLLKIPRGGYASRGIGVFFDIGLYDTLAIAAHEGWHQYTQRTFREPLPVWLEEGIASYMEGHRWDGPTPRFLPWANMQRFDQLRSASTRGDLVSLSKLLDGRPQDYLGTDDEQILTYYAQLWGLIHYLNEWDHGRYAPALRMLLADAAAGGIRRAVEDRLGARAGGMLGARVGPTIFLAYFNTDLDAAAREYAEFLDLVTRTGSRDEIAQGRSPIGIAAPAAPSR
jgi:hypothetical protein